MNNMPSKASELWNQLLPWQRIAAIASAISIVALLAVMALWMQDPAYATLYRNLNERDASAIVTELDAQSIPYRLDGGGTTIEVPADQVASARLKLAGKGLPQGGGAGFELFDGDMLSNLGMTQFMQKVNYQRALEGELGRTIAAIDGVEVARVHIALPEESLFAEEENVATASIILKTAPGVRLSASQAQAVRHLVANSVEGLAIEQISVADVNGVLYEAPNTTGEGATLAATSTQLETQRTVELQTQSDIQAMLDRTLGPNTTVVRVNVDMNWDLEESMLERYAPAGEVGSVVRSNSQEEESWTGANGEGAGGVPGVDPNAPVDVPTYQTGETGEGDYSRRTTTTNYEVSKEILNTVRQPGTIERITVAVLVDETLPAEQMDKVRALVEAAVGADEARGDLVQVQSIPFNDDFYAEESARLDQMQQQALYMRIGLIVGVLLGLGLILFFVRKIFGDMQSRMLPYVVEPETPALPGDSPSTALRNSAAAAYGGVGRTELGLDELFQLPAPDEAEMRLKAIARHNPEFIASVLEDWVAGSPAGV